jgi:UDP-4-amino-4,6-dideoxy-N-acetyl-beta-L-altrosamine transaminase
VTSPRLPYGRQTISADDLAAVAEALQSELITQGPTIARFEQAVADYVGASHAVAFANGTAALHGAAFAAGIGPGDEAVTTPLSFAASSNCVLYMGGTPRFADISAETWNLDPAAARAAVTERTTALIPVSFAGLPVDLDAFADIRKGRLVIEDAAHALGAIRNGSKVGGDGGADLTAFSFHPVKAMTTGEGGMVTTASDELAERLRLFRTHGITKDGIDPGPDEGEWYYEMQELGFNYRITDFQCALGLSQLRHLDDWIERRNEVAALYRRLLDGEARIGLPPAAPDGWRHGYHLFVIQVLNGAGARRRVFDALRAAGIFVQVHYIPIHQLPYYRDQLGYGGQRYPNAERYYSRAISLPVFPGMEEADVERVVTTLREAL